jgi:glycerate 2-kinase
LRLVKELAGKKGVLFISFATDGDDGPTDAAGAVTDGLVLREGIERFGLDIDTFIINNDSYHYFEKVGGLIKTGATGTNVNDLILMLFDS